MNIIYQLTNLTNGKKYIGQKVECRLENSIIINNKTELPYWGSSSNIQMKEDLKNHNFKAEILEIVNDKKDICIREDFWVRKLNAVESTSYYNLTYPLHYNKRDFQNSVKNSFGETYKEYAANESTISKRVNSAKKIGFNTLPDFYLDIIEKLKQTNNLAEIARNYNVERHTISRLVKDVNLLKFKNEIKEFDIKILEQIKNYIKQGVSIKKIASILNLEFSTILYYIGNVNYKNRNYLVSQRKNMTPDELSITIMRLFLLGKNMTTIAKELSLQKFQIERYFHRFIRKHIKINDLDGIQIE